MHIYFGQMYPFQLTIDVWYTTTSKKFHSHVAECTNMYGRCTYPPQFTRDVWNTTTLNKIHILLNAYIPNKHVTPISSNLP